MSVVSVRERLAREHVRLIATILLGAASLVGASGLTATAVFRQMSTLKWAVGFLAPLAIGVLINVARPLLVAVALVILAAPFGGLKATFAGAPIPFLGVIVAVAVVTALLAGPAPRSLGVLGWAALLAGLLLVVPVFTGAGIPDHLVLFGTAAVVGWLITVAAREPGGPRFLLGAFALSALIQAGIAIWEVHTKHQLNFYGAAGSTVFGRGYFFGFDNTFRPIGTFYDPISLGNVLALALPVTLALLATSRRPLGQLLSIATITVIGVGLLLSLSRMSWVGAAVGSLVTLVFLPAPLRGRAVGLLPVLAIVLALVVTGAAGHTFSDRFSSIFSPRNTSHSTSKGDTQRVEEWNAVLAIGSSHSVSGVGLGRLPAALGEKLPYVNQQSQAQSTYLQLWGEGGALGVSALAVLIAGEVICLYRALRRPQSRPLAAGVAGAVVALLAFWLSDVTARYAPVMACMTLIFAASAALSERPASEPLPSGEPARSSVRAAAAVT